MNWPKRDTRKHGGEASLQERMHKSYPHLTFEVHTCGHYTIRQGDLFWSEAAHAIWYPFWAANSGYGAICDGCGKETWIADCRPPVGPLKPVDVPDATEQLALL